MWLRLEFLLEWPRNRVAANMHGVPDGLVARRVSRWHAVCLQRQFPDLLLGRAWRLDARVLVPQRLPNDGLRLERDMQPRTDTDCKRNINIIVDGHKKRNCN